MSIFTNIWSHPIKLYSHDHKANDSYVCFMGKPTQTLVLTRQMVIIFHLTPGISASLIMVLVHVQFTPSIMGNPVFM